MQIKLYTYCIPRNKIVLKPQTRCHILTKTVKVLKHIYLHLEIDLVRGTKA